MSPLGSLHSFTLPLHAPLPPSQVAAGGTHTMALTNGGRIFVWGRASFGRLGLGDVSQDQYLPVECQLPGEG